MNTQTALAIIEVLSAIFLGFLALTEFMKNKRDKQQEDKDKQVDATSDLEIKLKEVEGVVSSKYAELSTKIDNLSKEISDNKISSSILEDRILTNIDKLDSKIERLQDLLYKTLIDRK